MHVDHQWEQGSILAPDDLRGDVRPNVGTGDFFVVISQSCDVICESFDAEPFVELHVARRIDEVDGNNAHGKNPRVLDFLHEANGERASLRCKDSERFRVDRRCLLGLEPSGKLSEFNTSLLANWTGHRFTRPAFPDEFNRRLGTVRAALARVAAGRDGTLVTAVFVGLSDPGELAPDEPYRVLVLGTMLADLDPQQAASGNQVVAKIADVLGSANGIDVLDYETRSEDAVSLAEARELLRLPFDYVTVRGEAQ